MGIITPQKNVADGLSCQAQYSAEDICKPADMTLLGSSSAMQQVSHTINKLAASNAPVTLTGESGTGKELAAFAIHNLSARSQGPFITVNCGAIPAGLIQSELFGYEKGAFTGAYRAKAGRIQAAAGGTIFLDEIADLPLDLQVNLLRFLQDGSIEHIGGTNPISVDVRVIAATHQDLENAVLKGTFRDDLYYRLNVLRLHMPPLRDRSQDVEELANFFLEKFSKESGGKTRRFSRHALQVINIYSWPGNVRELINRIQRAVVMSDSRLISVVDLDLQNCMEKSDVLRTLQQIRYEAEKMAIQHCLQYTRNNISEAARQLGISRLTLYRLIEKHHLSHS